MRTIYIYALECPKINKIRYIGQALNTKNRLKKHIRETIKKEGRKTKKEAWIQQLIDLKIENDIKIHILEKCNEKNIDEKEIFYIKKYKKLNYPLTNISEGGKSLRLSGENHPNYGKKASKKLRKKLSKLKKGKNNPMYGKSNPHTDDWNKKISKSLLNSKKLKNSRSSKKYREKISKVQSNKILILDKNTFKIKYDFKNCKKTAEFFNFTYSNIKNARRDKRIIGKTMTTKYYVIYEKDYLKIKNINNYFK